MCGRYTVTPPIEVIVEYFRIHDVRPDVLQEYRPRYNAAPGQWLPIIGSNDGKRAIALHRWGLIPSWAKDERIGYKMINARSETVTERPSYRDPFRRRRCLVPADGLYEWSREGKTKQPYRFTLPGQSLFAFAGLWDVWTGPDGQQVRSFTILTTTPNEIISPVHDRMPVILSPDAYDVWLDPHTPAGPLQAMLQPYTADGMVKDRVSVRVNSAAHDDPSLVESVPTEGTS